MRLWNVFSVTAVAAASLIAAPAVAQSGGVVASATGSGHITLGGLPRKFAFSAKRYADGTVQGQAQLHAAVSGTTLHLEVRCLIVAGNFASVSGVITRVESNFPIMEGQTGEFVVLDNGEGANAPPDVISSMSTPPFSPPEPAETACLTPNPGPTLFHPVEEGNIQVRG